MVQPVNPGILNQLANPGAQGLQQLSQTFAGIANDKRQNKLLDLQQREAKLKMMAQAAPAAMQLFQQAQQMPYEQRVQYFQQNADLLNAAGLNMQKAEPDDFTDQGLQKGMALFGGFLDKGGVGEIGKYNPRDYTTESWTSFLKSRNPSVLKRYETSMTERIATDENLANKVQKTQANIAGAKAGASEQRKSEVQLMMRPKIQKAIKEAEVQAKGRGETLTELDRAKAALPGLIEVVDKLKTLSDTATYTLSGRAFDVLSKELGFGATKGATARAKMQSLVDNQVLPLLRQTFGAAFTKEEGDRLRATMLDVNAAPEERKATLQSFIEQKMRDIETKERETGQRPMEEPGANLSPEDQQALEWAKANPNDPRAAQIMQLHGGQ